MNLFDRETFERFALSLPAATLVHQWGNTAVAKVGGKMFATHGNWDGPDIWQIGFKCSDMSFRMLPEIEGVYPARYLARARWVSVQEGSALPDDELEAYLRESHRLVAAKLTRSLKAELGLASL
ncbi:MAG: MmcQ/YjbR family DNA-binding protein [Hyphomicrobiaceae bacterium]|nr:MmcQ/YjbR family DNA-binding protein [Hyphomicrobiaceae bacterium]MCC0025075.1 MmcQ/YjbR family DNA-binding protein [Hyphomicrobiaceae bacterium]